MIARFRLDRGTLRAAGFVTLMTVVFLTVNTAVATAADGNADAAGGGLLGPLNMASSEGVPLDGYELEADGGTVLNVVGQVQVLVLGGLFSLVRLLVGLCCWLVDFVFEFPLLRLLTAPAQDLADAYNTHVVGALGLKGLLLGWAFIFGGIVFMRGKAGTGLGEIILTLVIAAFAASAFIRPDYLLGKDGPLNQAHEAAIEVAQITTRSYFGDTGARACEAIVGPARDTCVRADAQAAGVVQPIQDALTDALVVKPYMLLQYGRVLDPKNPADKAAYDAHMQWITTKSSADQKPETGPCRLLRGPAKAYCSGKGPTGLAPSGGGGPTNPLAPPTSPGFQKLLDDLAKAGDTGKAAAAYAKEPSWDRVGAALLLLVAVVVIALMVMSMVMVMFGAQAGDAAAAACGGVAWVWAMLPGPSRMALWRWFGVFIVSVMVSFVAAITLPLFGITVHVVFSRSGPDLMVERLLLLDAVAVAFLVFHRRMLAAASGFGQRLTTRMRFAKIGGSHLPGDNSEFGAALAVHGPRPGGSGGGFMGLGLSPAHSAFGARLRSLGSLAALTDPSGMPFAPGRAVGDALAEGRRGIAPLALALRGAHSLLVGPPPARHPAATALHQAAGGQLHPVGEMQVDQQTGEVLHDPATDRPLLGSRIHQGASRLRGYRIAHQAGRLAYGATFGLPRTLHAARTTTSEFTQDAMTQLRVIRSHLGDDAFAWGQGGRAVRDGVDHAGQRLATAWQVNDPAAAIRNTAIAAAIHTAPLTTAGRTPPPRTRPTPFTPTTVPADPPTSNSFPPIRPRAAASPAPPSRTSRPGPPLGRSGTAAGPRSAAGTDPAAEANAARLRARFEARAAERRRREGEDL